MKPYYCQLDGNQYPREACDENNLPVIREECTERPCLSETTWITGAWSACSKTCGKGTKMRTVKCKSLTNEILDDIYCEDKLKPNATQSCVGNVSCNVSHFASNRLIIKK